MATPKPPSSANYPLTQYLKVEQKFMPEVNAALQTSRAQIADRLSSSTRPLSDLSRARLQAELEAVKALSNSAFDTIGSVVTRGQGAAMSAAYDTIHDYARPLLSTTMSAEVMEAFFQGESRRAAAGIRTYMDRLGGSYVPLSDSVYNSKAWVNNQINKRVDVALVRGLSAREFAGSVVDLVNPNTPGGARYAANRLARTEINNAFHVGSVRAMNESGVVELVDWKLSGSHPKPDQCNEYAGDGPYEVNRVPSKPHPQCFCFIVPNLPSPEEFRANLLSGRYDDTSWANLAI